MYNFTLSGTWGSGKTTTMLSFVPNGKKYGDPIRRIIFDTELRCISYLSKTGIDDPNKLLFAFESAQTGGRVSGEIIYKVMEKTKTNQWKDGITPDMIGIDDIALWQDVFFNWMQNKQNALLVAKLYGKESERCFTSQNWKPYDAGTVDVFKKFITEWLLDLKAHNIYFVGNTPQHNIWKDYGQTGKDADGLPKMRTLGKSAKMLDAFQKMTDVIWVLDRSITNPDKTISLKALPTVKMDLFIAKASLPGVPEQFEWPGWTTIWAWHNERKYVADVTKIYADAPAFAQETIEEEIKKAKHKLANELKDFCKPAEIKVALDNEFAPIFSFEVATNQEKYDELKKWVMDFIEKDRAEKKKINKV